jgi:C4-dicarboxylate-specific signal transduction histidine kinase
MRALLVCGGVLVAVLVMSLLLVVADDASFPWASTVVLGVIALQGLLIVGLLLQRRWRRQAELEAQTYRAELYHAMRLATLGELTASIAHEINQPLGAILSNADAAEMMLEAGVAPDGEIRDVIADIRQDAQRASAIILQTRRMISKRPTGTGPVDLNQLVLDVRQFLTSALTHHAVSLDLHLAQQPMLVLGDTVQLQQVVLNLVVNAIDATAGAEDLVRRVDVRTMPLLHGRVALTVTDNGRGIPEDDLPHLFDAFFTTKPQGCGLGLSISRNIVDSHGGQLVAENVPTGGASFRIVLAAAPIGTPAPSEPPLAEAGRMAPRLAPRGNALGTKGH